MSWETLTSMPTVWNLVFCATDGTLIYVIPHSGTVSSLQVYDTAADSWSTLALPATMGGAGLAYANGYLYLVGGHDGSGTWDNAYRYSGSWAAIDDLPGARNLPAAAAAGGEVYVIGGSEPTFGGAFRDNNWSTPATSWTTETAAPVARRAEAYQAAGLDGSVYVPGGDLDGTGLTNRLDIFDGSSWSAGANVPAATNYMGVAAGHGLLFTTGGNTGGGTIRTVRTYDPGANTWDTLTDLPTARRNHAAAVVGDYLYVVGGAVGGSADGAALRLRIHEPAWRVGSIGFSS